jgi:hypothetical protein
MEWWEWTDAQAVVTIDGRKIPNRAYDTATAEQLHRFEHMGISLFDVEGLQTTLSN